MNGAQSLLKSLKNHGIKTIFSYPGGSVLPIFDAMSEFPSIRRIMTRHEQASAFAAAGFSRATREIGVCLATSGPGATNLITGIADAKMDSIPMIAITGNVAKHLIGLDAFQEVDIVKCCEPITKRSFQISSASEIPRAVDEAFFLATSGRMGPVLIDIPKSVQSEEVSPEIAEKCDRGEKFFHPKTEEVFDVSEISCATEILQNSSFPLAILGHGVVLGGAEEVCRDFLEKTGIPAVWTLHGIGILNRDSPLALGMIGMHGTATANFAATKADAIFSFGSRFDDRITGVPEEFARGKKIVHFDIDQSEFGKIVPVNAKIAGNLKETLPVFLEKVEKLKISGWIKTLEEKKKKYPLDLPPHGKLTEISVIESIFSTIDEESVVAVDVGQHEMWAAQRFPGKTRKFLASGGLGSMGFALPSAIGAAMTGNETWVIVGDGGIQMNLQEFATLAQDKIPVKVCILNNGFLGMVRQWQELFFDKNYVDTPLFSPDFVKIGESCGIPSFRATNPEEMRELVKKMKSANTPIIVEFVVEREQNVFPMVPPGKNLGETLISATKKMEIN